MILTAQELVALTRRSSSAAQARVLRRLGIPYRAHPTDGVLLVARDAALAVLGAKPPCAGQGEPDKYEVDIEGIRNHGTPTPAH